MTEHLSETKLIAHWFGLDSEQERRETAAHIAGCEECRRRGAALELKFSSLDLLREEVPAPDRLASDCIRRLRAAPAPGPARFRKPLLLAAAAAAFIIALAIPWFRGARPGEAVLQEANLAELREAEPFAPASNIELNVLPARDTVQLTIYNSADLTLVRERRNLTMKKGWNWLQFMWANTLIDPTSLGIEPLANREKVEVRGLVFPPRIRELGRWLIFSEISGQAPVEISYLTSGLSWRAFYMGTLAPDEKTMRLQGYVRATNLSGEDYENAETRLIVGEVHILDKIAELARRRHPYGSPTPEISEINGHRLSGLAERKGLDSDKDDLQRRKQEPALAPKEIMKEGLSEYFLYTIEGTETIPNGWSKRLPSVDTDEIPVINLYRFEEERYGKSVVRFLSFKNDKEHKLGATPIPGGMLKVYRILNDEKLLSYVGQSDFKYIPVDEDVELNLGAVGNVVVEPKLIDFSTDHYQFDRNGNINGWDETREFKVEVKNTRDLPVRMEIRRNFPTQHWDLEKSGEFGQYEKVDLDTVKFTVELDALSKKEFTYILTMRHGTRAE